jgi:pimeloyl-ACP methyl ester carboxylesterase
MGMLRELTSRAGVSSLFSAGILVVGSVVLATTAIAQSIKDIKVPKSPLELKAQGSFFVGGEKASQTATQLTSSTGLPGNITKNQMYVRYMLPTRGSGVPVILIHGGGLSGKSYETTPDGRMGWDEYFVRKGHDVYVPDQATRARSGFDQAVFNDVRAGLLPPSAQPTLGRTSDESAWTIFRFGPSYGVTFPDTQFPVQAAAEFSKQGIPNLNALLPTPNPMYKELADLAANVGGAVLVGHSGSGPFPFQTALTSPTGVKGMILIESGCTGYTDEQVKALAKIPMLIVFGDHLTTTGPFPFQTLFDGCKTLIGRVIAAGGNAKMLHPPELGIFGNSHMLMLDKNNLQIADLILKWIDRNVKYKVKGGGHDDDDDDHHRH